MKIKVALGVAVAIASINVNATTNNTSISEGQESISIMQGRFNTAYQDQMNNHNADERLKRAYNDLKMAKGGSSDTSNAPSAVTPFSAAAVASNVPTAVTLPDGYTTTAPLITVQKAPNKPKMPFGNVKAESIKQISETPIAAPAMQNNNYVPQQAAVPAMQESAPPKKQYLEPQPLKTPVAVAQKTPGQIPQPMEQSVPVVAPQPVKQSVPEIKPAITAPATLNNNNVPVSKMMVQVSETTITAPATLNNNNVPIAKTETREMLTAHQLQPTVQATLPIQRATSATNTVVQANPNAVASYSAQIVANQAIETAEQNRQSLNNERAARVTSDKQTLAEANAHTDSRFSELKKYDQETRNHANAGTASALAASQIPQVYGEGKFMVGAGAGTYSDQQAVAVGMSFSVNNKFVVKSAVTADTQSNFGAGVGVGVQFN